MTAVITPPGAQVQKDGFRPFTLGDIVASNANAPYTITKKGWKGEITAIFPLGTHPNKCDIQVDGFDVHSQHFTLVKKGNGKVKGKVLLVILKDSKDEFKVFEFYKAEDINASLKNFLDSGDGLKPHQIRVYEVASRKEVEFSIDTKLTLK